MRKKCKCRYAHDDDSDTDYCISLEEKKIDFFVDDDRLQMST